MLQSSPSWMFKSFSLGLWTFLVRSVFALSWYHALRLKGNGSIKDKLNFAKIKSYWRFPACIYLSKVNHGCTGIICEIRPKLTIMASKRHYRRRCGGTFIVNVEQNSLIFLLFLLLTLSKYMSSGFICRNGRTLVSVTRFVEAAARSCFSK